MTTQPAALTAAQQRILTDVRRAGVRTYNGRARLPVGRLEALGLVTVDWDARPVTKGNGIQLVEKITVRPHPGTLTKVFFAPYHEFGIPDPAEQRHQAPQGPVIIEAVGYCRDGEGTERIVIYYTAVTR